MLVSLAKAPFAPLMAAADWIGSPVKLPDFHCWRNVSSAALSKSLPNAIAILVSNSLSSAKFVKKSRAVWIDLSITVGPSKPFIKSKLDMAVLSTVSILNGKGKTVSVELNPIEGEIGQNQP